MQVAVFDTQGKATGKISLPEEMFAVKINPPLVAQAVRVYLANQRQGTAKAKTRGEVTGSGKKIWRQKGTGRARHGDRYAPIFVGGGVAHGPRGNQNVKRQISKKMRRHALFSVLSQKMKDKEIIVIEGLDELKPKTKIFNSTINNFRKDNHGVGKTLIVATKDAKTVHRASRNLANVKLLLAEQLNAYEVINSNLLLVTKDAIDKLKQTFIKFDNQSISSPIKEIKKSKQPIREKKKTTKKSAARRVTSKSKKSTARRNKKS